MKSCFTTTKHELTAETVLPVNNRILVLLLEFRVADEPGNINLTHSGLKERKVTDGCDQLIDKLLDQEARVLSLSSVEAGWLEGLRFQPGCSAMHSSERCPTSPTKLGRCVNVCRSGPGMMQGGTIAPSCPFTPTPQATLLAACPWHTWWI